MTDVIDKGHEHKIPEDKKYDDVPVDKRVFYQKFDLDQVVERGSYHYEVNPEFFKTVLSGEWNSYSCVFCEDDITLTEAQERKLDKFAELMQLKPGMKILDVGCGWGGPIVYLCHKYGVTGHGITISPMAIPACNERAEKYGVDATFEVRPWQELEGSEEYDAIFTDEAIVHFHDLQGFFETAHRLLKKDGMMVNKELHFTHSEYAHADDRLSQHINKVFGYTGNYITLAHEIDLLDKAGFKLDCIYDVPMRHYHKTIGKNWIKQIRENKEKLIGLSSEKHVRDYTMYLKGILSIFHKDRFRLHMVAGRKK